MRRFPGLLLAAALMAAPGTAIAFPGLRTLNAPAHVDSSSKPRLGITVISISPELQTFYGSTDKTGVLVSHVEPGSPAALAGIAVGDVLLEVGGNKVDDATDVLAALTKASAGQSIQVKLLREHKAETFDVKLETATSFMQWLPTEWLRSLFAATTQKSCA